MMRDRFAESVGPHLPTRRKPRRDLTSFRSLSDDELTQRLRAAEIRAKLLQVARHGPARKGEPDSAPSALGLRELDNLRRETNALLASLRAERRRRP